LLLVDVKTAPTFNQFLKHINTPDLINIVKGSATQKLHLLDTIKGIRVLKYSKCMAKPPS
jgi:hypothetical protein